MSPLNELASSSKPVSPVEHDPDAARVGVELVAAVLRQRGAELDVAGERLHVDPGAVDVGHHQVAADGAEVHARDARLPDHQVTAERARLEGDRPSSGSRSRRLPDVDFADITRDPFMMITSPLSETAYSSPLMSAIRCCPRASAPRSGVLRGGDRVVHRHVDVAPERFRSSRPG